MMKRTLTKRTILLNPGPATTTDRVKQSLIVPDICPREREFGELGNRVRKKVVAVVRGSDTHVAVLLAGSGTAAVESCLSSIIGDHHRVLILDNGAYGRRAEQIVQAYGIAHTTYRLAWGDYPDVKDLERLIQETPGLTHLFFVHHETTTGMLNPLPEFIQLCQRYNLVSIVDAMSSYAGIPIDLRTTPADYLISSSNKCIQGFAGISMVIADRNKLENTAAIPARNLYLNLYQNYRFWEKNRQFQFTPPVQILYALNTALDEFFEETQEGRYARYCASYDEVIKGLKQIGLRCLLPSEHHSKLLTAIVEPEFPGYSFEEMHDYLFREEITIYPGKGATENTFRIANIGAIDREDVARAMTLIKQYLDQISNRH